MGEPSKILEDNYSLYCEYTEQSVKSLLESEFTLAVFTFDGKAKQSNTPRLVHTGLKPLAENSLREVWRSNKPVLYGRTDAINWADNGDHLFCSVHVDDPVVDIEKACYHVYISLLNFTANRGYPFIERVWNYFTEINKGDGDNERYKKFCLGRYNAFERTNRTINGTLYPAACAIGHQNGGMNIYLIAGRRTGTYHENPEQLSAYHYPREYGPKSPSFARATFLGGSGNSRLYLSGTASIKGHTTLFPGEAMKQLTVTLDNIDRLLNHIAKSENLKAIPEMSCVKVYVRHPEDYPQVRIRVAEHFPIAQILFVQGDICRCDLDVEIDGFCHLKRMS